MIKKKDLAYYLINYNFSILIHTPIFFSREITLNDNSYYFQNVLSTQIKLSKENNSDVTRWAQSPFSFEAYHARMQTSWPSA